LDEELLSLHKESDEKGIVRELFNRYLEFIYGVCLNYLNDADSAEEAVIQIFNDLLRNLDNYDIPEFRIWIYDFTKKYCLQQQGKENVSATTDINDPVAELDRVVKLFESKDEKQMALLTDCLKDLPQQQRMCINYFFKDKLSYAEIADKADCKLKYVKKYIQKGKQILLNCTEKTDE